MGVDSTVQIEKSDLATLFRNVHWEAVTTHQGPGAETKIRFGNPQEADSKHRGDFDLRKINAVLTEAFGVPERTVGTVWDRDTVTITVYGTPGRNRLNEANLLSLS